MYVQRHRYSRLDRFFNVEENICFQNALGDICTLGVVNLYSNSQSYIGLAPAMAWQWASMFSLSTWKKKKCCKNQTRLFVTL
jgi:hypothetical protein